MHVVLAAIWGVTLGQHLSCQIDCVYTPGQLKTIKMQLDVEESTPASDMTYWFRSKIAIGNCHQQAITCNMFCFLAVKHGQCAARMWRYTQSVFELWPMALTFTHNLHTTHIYHHTQFGDSRSSHFRDMNFFLVNFFLVWILVKSQTDRQTQSNAYEPTVHTHRCAQKVHFRKIEITCQFLKISKYSPQQHTST